MRVTLTVNGGRLDLDVEPGRTLADALSTECAVTGGHLGCRDGTCGACTVSVDGETIRACLMLAVQCDGARVITVEGLPDDHPVRAVLAVAELDSCGPCLPGLVMLAAGAIDRDPSLAAKPEQLRRLLAANVCRRAGHPAVSPSATRAAVQAGDPERSGPR